jgi:carbonic anhydrase
VLEFMVGQPHMRQVVLCGHADCVLASHLLTPDGPTEDILLRDWLSHAETARHTLGALSSPTGQAAVEHCLLAQRANLLTHPAIVAGVARGQLRVWVWIYDPAVDELYYPTPGENRFQRLVALHPDQNAGLRREVVRRPRPFMSLKSLDPKRLGLA